MSCPLAKQAEKQNSDFNNVSGKTRMIFTFQFVQVLKIMLKRKRHKNTECWEKKKKYLVLKF